ncbi:MAG: DNA mismatch repair protein MutS, partial [Mahellales bacterium]
MEKLTPMMQQYLELKEQYKDTILLFRLGDFYEMFFEDAKLASPILGIALTGRDCGLKDRAPMCGVPYHSVNNYIAKLVSKGYKVAICEQLEDPSLAKGIVKRDVVRVITPGTFIEDMYINEKDNNYLLSISMVDDGVGISYVDLSTGEFYATQIINDDWKHVTQDELLRIRPSEIIVQQDINDIKQLTQDIKKKINCHIWDFNGVYFKHDIAYKKLISHFKVINLSGFELEDKPAAVGASGALLQYLTETQRIGLAHINRIHAYNIVDYMILDSTTRRNLELVETMINKTKKGSLLWLLDKTLTAMGGRMLKNWIQQPLISSTLIKKRLYGVKEIIDSPQLLDGIKDCLKGVYDIERIISKLSLNMVNGRDLISLKRSIKVLPQLKESLGQCSSEILKEFFGELDTLDDIFLLIDRTIVEEPPITIKEGGLIKTGYNDELDNLKSASSRGKEWIAAMERDERDKTGIKNLKIGFNKVFGYYIEVTKSNYGQVPDRYTRKQTLANCERYITSELK